MTMVAGCKFHDGAVIIADSRATWEKANGRIFSDNAQKILHLGPKLAISFAGRVDVAERIVRELRTRLKKDPTSRIPRKCANEFPRIARFYYKKYSKILRNEKDTVSFVLGGCETMSGVFLWAYNAPDFNPQEIRNGYVVVGSGAVVDSYLSKNYTLINNKTSSLRDKANILFTGLESELQKYEIDTVGGLFQIILLDSGGIRPMTYGFMDLTPDKPGFSKEIEMSKGVWVQKDLIKKTIMKIIEPIRILGSLPKQDRFHDYELPKGNRKELRWYLNYFITCLKTQKDATITKFIGVLAQIGSFHYPRSVSILASLGF